MQLSPEQARVLGSLVEKQLTTPQQYPLTMAALVAACNQTTSRDPVTAYDESAVLSAVDDLKLAHLVRSVLPSHGRSAVRYRHVLDETLALNAAQCALFAVLLLRGPQTLAELRTRTDRMAEFDSLSEVERELEWLTSRDVPLTVFVGRKPGQKEDRWATPVVEARAAEPVPERAPLSSGWPDEDTLREDVARLAAEVAELRHSLEELRASLGD